MAIKIPSSVVIKPKKSFTFKIEQIGMSDQQKTQQNLELLFNYFSLFSKDPKKALFDELGKVFDFSTYLLFTD